MKIHEYTNSLDPDEAAHHESLHLALHCLSSGPSCSKLTMSLVNVLLNFQTFISQICQYFCQNILKSFSLFFNKNISVFGYKGVKHLTSRSLNELVKLMML